MKEYSKDPEITQFMEMPCLCDCGNWFDLNDGYGAENENKIICEECHRKEEQAEEFWYECEDAFFNDNFRTLSWNQPYAALMLHGKIETRKRPTNVRGKVLICACKKRYDLGTIMSISGRIQYDRMSQFLVGDEAGITGKAIAVGDLVGCRPMTFADEDKCFVEFVSDKWCWVFDNVHEVEAFDFKGKQGWGFVTEDILSKIRLKQ